uniref:Doublecortin domain-containing protein n=1 Tax=Steinernema glaseri TaxID=37863 RepID=A0A1I7Z8T8_9BILA
MYDKQYTTVKAPSYPDGRAGWLRRSTTKQFCDNQYHNDKYHHVNHLYHDHEHSSTTKSEKDLKFPMDEYG